MVEKAETSESTVQPSDSGDKGSEGSKGQPQSPEGIIIGLRKQLSKAKDDIKALKDEMSASRDKSEEGGDHPGWAEDDQIKKELARLQKEIKSLRDAKATSDREVKVMKLSSQTGIPMEVLSDAKDDFELAQKVAEFKADMKAEGEKPSEGTPKGTPPYEAGGVAPGTEKDVWSMTNREFAEKYGQEQAEARRSK